MTEANGIPTRMDVPSIVKLILKKGGGNQTLLGRRLGVDQSTVSRWLRGAKPETDQLDRLSAEAARLGIIAFTSGKLRSSVPIVGHVGAGGSILFSEGQGPFGDAPVPPDAVADDLVAVRVRGDSMAPIEDGWLVYYADRRDPPTDDLMHKLCVVGLADGRVLVKKLQPGTTPGRYVLYSYNAAPLTNELVAWAARVTFLAPA